MLDHPTLKNLNSKDYAKAPKVQNSFLESLGKPHLDSFNYMLHEGLAAAVENIKPLDFQIGSNKLFIKIKTIRISPSVVPPGLATKCPRILPSECRQRGATYSGPCHVVLEWSVNGVNQTPLNHHLGRVPIMLKSDLCHLSKLSPAELVEHNEHEDEWGGYFVVKGSEKLIRMLLLTRRNYPIAVKRNSWKNRGPLFSDLGILIRCVRNDQLSSNNVLHFVTDGSAKLMIAFRRTLFYIPVLLIIKALINKSDEHIFKCIVSGYDDDFYFKGCILSMLRSLQQEMNIFCQADARNYIGKTFRSKLPDVAKDVSSDEEICDYILDNSVCIHLRDYHDKFNCLSLMIKKLYSFVQQKCINEGVDSIMNQELLLGGHLYLQVLADRMRIWMAVLKANISKKYGGSLDKFGLAHLQAAIKTCGTIEATMESFLSTGNVSNASQIGIPQDKGLVIIAENINRMRYMSHFKAVHRGSFFQEMRTTEVRQLLPDAWGFICPVHTPDGSPCGLLNHLTKACQVTTTPDEKLVQKLPEVLAILGMQPLEQSAGVPPNACYPVLLDGKVIGYLPFASANRFVQKLRFLKIFGEKVPSTLEIALLPNKDIVCQFPGLFLFTGPARLMRPVYNLEAKQIELIGTLEQVYLDISVIPEENVPNVTTHQELSKDNFLSNLACLIPMPDCNQSPRNMYQCQMGKQTMGTACHTWHIQAETKLYRLQTPATPLFRPLHYDNINLDNYAMGTNAIVAVISYTGYDMEDAMIINKASLERGFAHGSILKSEFVELKNPKSYFGLDPAKPELRNFLGEDGLPYPGTKLSDGTPYYCYYDEDTQNYVTGKHHGSYEVVIDNVRMFDPLGQKKAFYPRACITLRVPRNPTVGDKFASRAGQKGICSYKWQVADLPFTESGLVPDIVFNPHGFPSRMTIAMMIECMAGKSAALHGLVHDASPFKFNEQNTAIDYFGRMLQAGGYNYYGTERMYSGIDGREMTADIFFGIVHYQRLRHMVSDKWQVRSTGPIDVITKQPVKGRKRGGGVRFGEMERDALLAHGACFLLQDRLFNCSDKSSTLICRTCGNILSPTVIEAYHSKKSQGKVDSKSAKCKLCQEKGKISLMEIPYVFKYLAAQLASVNINVKLRVTDAD